MAGDVGEFIAERSPSHCATTEKCSLRCPVRLETAPTGPGENYETIIHRNGINPTRGVDTISLCDKGWIDRFSMPGQPL